MGSRVQKIVFLIFALAFVAIMAVLNSSILTMGTSSNSQLSSVVMADDNALSIYDNQSVFGNAVIKCAKAPNNISTTEMKVFVITTADKDNGAEYTAASPYSNSVIGAKAINNGAKFDSYICYNANSVATGLLFIQAGAAPTGDAVRNLIGDLNAIGFTATTSAYIGDLGYLAA